MADPNLRAIALLDEAGQEIPSDERLTIPSGFKRPATLEEQVQRLVRHWSDRHAAANQVETFEEAEDFEDDEGDDPTTPYEAFFDPVLGKELTAQEFKQHEAVYRKRYLDAQRDYLRFQDRLEDADEARKRRRRAAGEPKGGAGGGEPPASTPPVRPTSEE